jgi:hypothetical protein
MSGREVTIHSLLRPDIFTESVSDQFENLEDKATRQFEKLEDKATRLSKKTGDKVNEIKSDVN